MMFSDDFILVLLKSYKRNIFKLINLCNVMLAGSNYYDMVYVACSTGMFVTCDCVICVQAIRWLLACVRCLSIMYIH